MISVVWLSNLSGEDYRLAFDHALASYVAVLVFVEASVQYSVADLVCIFVWVVFCHLFG